MATTASKSIIEDAGYKNYGTWLFTAAGQNVTVKGSKDSATVAHVYPIVTAKRVNIPISNSTGSYKNYCFCHLYCDDIGGTTDYDTPYDTTNYTWSSRHANTNPWTVAVRNYNTNIGAYFNSTNYNKKTIDVTHTIRIRSCASGVKGSTSSTRSEGGGATFTCKSTLTLDAPPWGTCAIDTISGNKDSNLRPYATRSTCSIHIDVRGLYGGKITSVKLVLGSYTYTISNINQDGYIHDFTNVPLNEVGTFRPQIVVTDSRQQNTTIQSSNTVTVVALNAPSFNYLTSINTNSYWKDVTQITYTISDTQSNNYGATIGTNSTVLQINNNSYQGTGNCALTSDIINVNNTTETITVTDSYGASRSNSLDHTLQTPYVTCQIETIRIGHQNSSDASSPFVEKDEGTSCLIVAQLTRSVINYIDNNSITTVNYFKEPTIQINNSDNNIPNIVWYENFANGENNADFSGLIDWNGNNGKGYDPKTALGNSVESITIYGFLSNYSASNVTLDFDVDRTYVISCTPKTRLARNDNTAINITGDTISDNLLQAFYLIAGKRGGHSLGIGMKPPTKMPDDSNAPEGLYINMDTYISVDQIGGDGLTPATGGPDMELFNSILGFGWYEDVIL